MFLSSSTIALAEETGEPSASAILFDVLLVRPLGIASIAIGSAVFIVGLPFTLPTNSVRLSAKKLVGEPFDFTFRRPVGEIYEPYFNG